MSKEFAEDEEHAKAAASKRIIARIFEEMINTENSFLEPLRFIAQNKEKIEENIIKNGKLSEEQKKTFVGIINLLEAIKNNGEKLLLEFFSLQQIEDTNEAILEKLKKILIKQSSLFSMYASRYRDITIILEQGEFDLEFEKLFDSAKKITAEQTTARIAAEVLITPIQRFPRYELLLKEIIRNLSKDDPRKHGFTNLLEFTKVETEKINETRRRVDIGEESKQYIQLENRNKKSLLSKTLKISFDNEDSLEGMVEKLNGLEQAISVNYKKGEKKIEIKRNKTVIATVRENEKEKVIALKGKDSHANLRLLERVIGKFLEHHNRKSVKIESSSKNLKARAEIIIKSLGVPKAEAFITPPPPSRQSLLKQEKKEEKYVSAVIKPESVRSVVPEEKSLHEEKHEEKARAEPVAVKSLPQAQSFRHFPPEAQAKRGKTRKEILIFIRKLDSEILKKSAENRAREQFFEKADVPPSVERLHETLNIIKKELEQGHFTEIESIELLQKELRNAEAELKDLKPRSSFLSILEEAQKKFKTIELPLPPSRKNPPGK